MTACIHASQTCATVRKNFNEESGHDVPLDTYRTDHLKHRLLQHFGDSLIFFRSSKRMTGQDLVMTESVTKRFLLEHAADMQLRPFMVKRMILLME